MAAGGGAVRCAAPAVYAGLQCMLRIVECSAASSFFLCLRVAEPACHSTTQPVLYSNSAPTTALMRCRLAQRRAGGAGRGLSGGGGLRERALGVAARLVRRQPAARGPGALPVAAALVQRAAGGGWVVGGWAGSGCIPIVGCGQEAGALHYCCNHRLFYALAAACARLVVLRGRLAGFFPEVPPPCLAPLTPPYPMPPTPRSSTSPRAGSGMAAGCWTGVAQWTRRAGHMLPTSVGSSSRHRRVGWDGGFGG